MKKSARLRNLISLVIFPEGLKFSATSRMEILELRKTFNIKAEFRHSVLRNCFNSIISSSDKGVFQSSLTNQSPPFIIFSFGEKLPNQFSEGLQSSQRETVGIKGSGTVY